MAYRDEKGRKPGRYGREGQGDRRKGDAEDRRTPRKAGPPPRVDGRPRPYPPRVDERPAPRPMREDERPRPRPQRPTPPPPMHRVEEGEASLPRENLLPGRNPIREAIRSGRDIERLLVARGELSGSAREIVAMAREAGIVIQTVDRTRLDELAPSHQGMIAVASAYRYSTVEDMFALAKERGEEPLLVVLDGITDPHNLGAIIRSAECAGAHGVIVPDRRAVGLTPAAVKASAGAVAYLPVARVGNLSRFLDGLKQQGMWVTAADMDGELYTQADLTGPMALVIGAEGSGVSRLVLEQADRRVALPMLGKIDSLNASVAAGVILYEIRRQRG